jgi:hypothetical protein
MIKIFLDDIRIPFDDDWRVVTTYQAFVDMVSVINFNDIEIISLDHDLSDFDIDGNEKTGYDVAKWLVDQAIDRNENLPLIKVHSANPAGANNIIKYINRYLQTKNMAETSVCWIVNLKRGIKL